LPESVEAVVGSDRRDKGRRAGPVGCQELSSTVMDEARWAMFWSWRRVAENERARTYEERLEYRQRELKT